MFDPLGLANPFTITIKLLLQDLWKLKLQWDEEIPNEYAITWRKWLNQVPLIEELCIDRYIHYEEHMSQIHIFADASPKAYGAVVYMKTDNNVTLLLSKNRVAPLKTNVNDPLTLAKLELTAALIASRLYDYLNTKLRFAGQQVCLWSDSKITLHWIAGNPERWKNVYVRNRVREIQKNTRQSEWRFCPGKDNPADLLTRGVCAKELVESSIWQHGPAWLKKNEENWPSDNEEIKSMTVATHLEHLLPPPIPDPIFPITKFNSLSKIYIVTLYVIRFIKQMRRQTQEQTSGLGFSSKDWRRAEQYWVKYVQQNYFPNELLNLKGGSPVPRESHILKFNPFMDDDGLIRIGGRLQFANLCNDIKHPIILPKDSHLSKLMVAQTHKQTMHGGINTVLNKLRERFWIIKARQLIKSTIAKCVICQRLRGKTPQQVVAPLPKDRICSANPFEITGIDFAGPLYTDKNEKAYIVLFTCAVTRAVHLELSPRMTTEAFISALRRFIARRGVPLTIYSDNAKTFKRSKFELQELSDIIAHTALHAEVTKFRIEWKYIVERAAWWGGWWERMVRTVKAALKSCIGRKSLNCDQLQTILCEAEAAVNSRPLTYIDDEEPHALTPSDFLMPTKRYGIDCPPRTSRSTSDVVRLWRERQMISGKFWKRWQNDYLLQLRSAHEQTGKERRMIKVNDIVIIVDKTVSRLLWKLARVEKVFPGRDGKIRSCELKTESGLLRRPIQLLVHLELDAFSARGEDVGNCENQRANPA